MEPVLFDRIVNERRLSGEFPLLFRRSSYETDGENSWTNLFKFGHVLRILTMSSEWFYCDDSGEHIYVSSRIFRFLKLEPDAGSSRFVLGVPKYNFSSSVRVKKSDRSIGMQLSRLSFFKPCSGSIYERTSIPAFDKSLQLRYSQDRSASE